MPQNYNPRPLVSVYPVLLTKVGDDYELTKLIARFESERALYLARNQLLEPFRSGDEYPLWASWLYDDAIRAMMAMDETYEQLRDHASKHVRKNCLPPAVGSLKE